MRVALLVILISAQTVRGMGLMGGHVDNTNNKTEDSQYYEYDYLEEQVNTTERIPTPSPLVRPGYNLPETIFNKGKPFYAEKDPLTGRIDLDHKSPSLQPTTDDDNSSDYLDEQFDIYNKENIDRKDGSLDYHHKQADVNQLTPNFHDFLNLPVKYNSNKYVVPLISSSYASTKIQGSVNKYHNHKDSFGVKTSTMKAPVMTTESTVRTTQRTVSTTSVTRPTTVKRYPELTTVTTTTLVMNLLNSPMSHPSFGNEYDYDEDSTTTTTTIKPSTTTKRTLTLFEQLFGDYDETVVPTTTTEKVTTKDTLSVEPLQPKPTTYRPSSSTITTTPSTTTPTTTVATTSRVTSLPLGENHITFKQDPIIVATQHLREKLNSEKVPPLAPSSSSVHIAPGQDTASFVVGHHQSVGDGLEPFRPFYGEDDVVIQPEKTSETSLTIGSVPQKVPGQVMDAPLDNKVVFPEDKPKEVLKLSSKPMYHQLPADLTPPPRLRPPWDPRPGHFYSGKPEYVRPPRPPPPPSSSGIAYKRIDNLPNILPQFRPNIPFPRLTRQPLLERPSNRPIYKRYPPPQMYHRIPQPSQNLDTPMAEDRIINVDTEPFQTPPNIGIHRRPPNNNNVETLQMIQSKQEEKIDNKTIYKVYPVNEFQIEQTRNDSPILKPHLKPVHSSFKPDFPYPLERPDESSNNLDWPKLNQISATLKTYTDKPIAIAYTPTTDSHNPDKYSMPNYGSPVIPEIRPGLVDNAPTGYEINHRVDRPETDILTSAQDFQAPFLASVKVDVPTNQGWSVVKSNNKSSNSNVEVEIEATTLPLATTSEFDIENFRPQLIGGFKPLYTAQQDDGTVLSDRAE